VQSPNRRLLNVAINVDFSIRVPLDAPGLILTPEPCPVRCALSSSFALSSSLIRQLCGRPFESANES